jgi:hypothetical protein
LQNSKKKNSLRDQTEEDSLAKVGRKTKLATAKTNTVYKDRTVYRNSYGNNVSNSTSSQAATQKTVMSKAAKGTIIGTVGGAAAGAIISKKIEEQVL